MRSIGAVIARVFRKEKEMSHVAVQAILWIVAFVILLAYLRRRRKRKTTTLP